MSRGYLSTSVRPGRWGGWFWEARSIADQRDLVSRGHTETQPVAERRGAEASALIERLRQLEEGLDDEQPLELLGADSIDGSPVHTTPRGTCTDDEIPCACVDGCFRPAGFQCMDCPGRRGLTPLRRSDVVSLCLTMRKGARGTR